MLNKNDYFAEVYHQLNNWLNEVKHEQKPRITELLRQTKQYAIAAENMSEEKIQQFVENMKYDLRDFYILNKTQAEHSVYLGLLNETLWDTLAKLTDKSQVEWAEITEDFTHDGIYQSGDFIGFGELACEDCDNLFTVSHYIEIIPCTNCGHTRFTRTPLQP
jgi:hypothetical protein